MSASSFPGLPWHSTRKATFVSDIHDNVIAEIAESADRASIARLLAAAPDLFRALETFVEQYVGLVESGDAGFWDPEKEPKVIAARAALSKANPVQP